MAHPGVYLVYVCEMWNFLFMDSVFIVYHLLNWMVDCTQQTSVGFLNIKGVLRSQMQSLVVFKQETPDVVNVCKTPYG